MGIVEIWFGVVETGFEAKENFTSSAVVRLHITQLLCNQEKTKNAKRLPKSGKKLRAPPPIFRAHEQSRQRAKRIKYQRASLGFDSGRADEPTTVH